MTTLFNHRRLHVGYRQRDWERVWYEPVGAEDEDGGSAIGLFKFTTGEAGFREPTEGEVLWLPEFDVKNCEARTIPEKRKIQKEFLTDAWKYLAEQDPEEVARMDEELDQPDWPRWQKWFQHAQKYKRKTLRQRENRKRKRKAMAKEAGATDAEIRDQVNSDTSDDGDSAYNSDSQQLYRKRMSSSSPDMYPPKRRMKKPNGLSGHWSASPDE